MLTRTQKNILSKSYWLDAQEGMITQSIHGKGERLISRKVRRIKAIAVDKTH
jgi:hypothetical protein